MSLPTDPMLPQQWHLGNTGGLLDLNVRGVWNPSQGSAYTGAGTWVVVIDDGFDYTHSDLSPNYRTDLDFDFAEGDFDPFGLSSDSHGTAVTGIIGADDNGTGAVGVAFDSSLIGYRVSGLISDTWLLNISDAISAAALNARGDVTNISQGIANDADSEYGAGYDAARFDSIEASIGTAVRDGRGGLGMTIVKSAGNSRSDNYDVNADDWTNDTRQVVVAAVDQNGFVSSYSSYGAAVLVSGFGTPGEVVTTDRVGPAGYNAGDFTLGFNGTSAAAPMVTGIVSLIYDANPDLGWRDVQSILANSARHVGSAVGSGISGSERYAWDFNNADTWNGGGLHFSNDYGYGLVDGLAAVRLSETWLLGAVAQKTDNQFTNTMDMLNTATLIADGNAAGTTFSGFASFHDIVERVTVSVTFSTTFLADVEIYLISPEGTVSELIDDVASDNDFNGTWTYESQAFRGERAVGTWQVRIVDDASGDTLTVSDVVVTTYGDATQNDRYIYTNEYSDYAGSGNHLVNVNDVNGGTDTVNAAAVRTASTIRLNGSVSRIDGVETQFTNIENAIGGDAGDTIIGSIFANMLYGMRGNDRINAGEGSDTLDGGAGNDTLDGGTGIDSMTGGDGSDTYYVSDTGDQVAEANGSTAGGTDIVYSEVSFTLGNNVEDLTLTGTANRSGTGNALGNHLTGNTGDNALQGRDGNDTLAGGDGADELRGQVGEDRMNGGNGNDRYFVEANGDQTIENNADLATGGIDTVYTSITRTLNANIENLRLQGSSDIGGNGNSLNNKIFGNSGGNLLRGFAGNDTIEGKDGADTLDGGEGNDTLSGGGQADVFRFATSNAGVDRILDFSKNFDRFDLSGGTFTALTTAANGDAVLTHTGGTIRIASPPTLTLAQWNALVLPSGARAEADDIAFDGTDHAFALRQHDFHGDWLIG